MGYSHGHKFTAEEIERAKEMMLEGRSLPEIAEELGVSYNSIQQKLKSLSITYQNLGIKNLKMHGIRKLPPIKELIDHLQKGRDLIQQFDYRQREVFPEYQTDGWVGLVFYGDGHFDHYKTDVKNLIADLNDIGQQQEVFMVFNGDVGDWSDIRFPGYNMPSFLHPIRLRYMIVHHLFDQIPNLLAMVAGCHDDWLKNRGFFDIVESIAEKRNELGLPTYYLGYGGTMNFQVGKAMYRIAIHHKLLGSSRFNIFHECVRYLQDNDHTVDIVAVAHRHDKCGISHQYYQGIPRVFVRSGSRQYLTDYAMKLGFRGAIAKAPMVLLNGAKKEMRACPDYKAGLEELRALNK